MKHCTGCETDKPLSEFNDKQHFCKMCQRDRSAKWYQENKERQLKNITKGRKKYEQQFRDYKDELACSVCGEDERCCLEFHHIDPSSKVESVTRMVGNQTKWSVVLEEIKKCVVLCSNCHKKFHNGIIKMPL